MKKLVLLAVMAIAVLSLATAEVGIAVGAKGIIGLPLGTTLEWKLDNGEKQKLTVNSGGAVFIKYELPFTLPLDSKLGVQLDVGFNANNGTALENKDKKYESAFSFNMLDIPLLITYRLPIGQLLDVRVGVGPNFGIVLGKMKTKELLDGNKIDPLGENDVASKLLIGLMADVGIGLNLGPGALLIDVRFLNDFTKFALDFDGIKEDFLTRRNLSLSVGYEMKF